MFHVKKHTSITANLLQLGCSSIVFSQLLRLLPVVAADGSISLLECFLLDSQCDTLVSPCSGTPSPVVLLALRQPTTDHLPSSSSCSAWSRIAGIASSLVVCAIYSLKCTNLEWNFSIATA
jgi:hypothetical protein